MSIGQRIAQKRKELGLSQEALGDRLGVSRQSIYKWESDSALPEVEKLIALSKLFGVSVGWLLGVEEGAAPEAAPSGELTEAQLKMVEEIVDRYIAALPRPKPRRRWPWVLAAVALLFVGWSLFQRLDQMDQQYDNLQNSVNNVTYSVNSQIGGISSRVEEILKAQNNLTAEYGAEIVHTNLQKNQVVFNVYAVPKTYVEGMTVKFSADSGTGGIQSSLGEEGFNQRLSTTLACELTDSIALSVSFLYPDGTLQTQLLDTYEQLYTDSLPRVDISMDNLMHSKLAGPGLFTIPAPNDSSVRYALIAPDQEGDAPAISTMRVGLSPATSLTVFMGLTAMTSMLFQTCNSRWQMGTFSALPPSSRTNTGAPSSVPACLIFWMKPEKSLPGRMKSILIPTHPTGNIERKRKRPDLRPGALR